MLTKSIKKQNENDRWSILFVPLMFLETMAIKINVRNVKYGQLG